MEEKEGKKAGENRKEKLYEKEIAYLDVHIYTEQCNIIPFVIDGLWLKYS